MSLAVSPARLSFATGPRGQLAAEWGPGPELRALVPGGENGEEVLLIRDWPGVKHALRFRDLRAISRGHALAGVTLQHDDGLLRLPDGSAREAVNSLWTPEVAKSWQPVIAIKAVRHAQPLAGSGAADLVSGFCGPYVADVIATLAGLGSGEQALRLRELSDKTTGALLSSPAARGPAQAAWGALGDFLEPVAARARARPALGGLMGTTIQAWDAAGMSPEAVFHAAACAWNGFPTVAPALARVLEQVLTRPGALEMVRADPGMAGPVVREAMYHAAHFTFALPGILTSPVYRDGREVAPRGCPVLPVVHAAHADRPRAWDPGPRSTAGLAFGAGIHACLARHIAPVILAEALRALAALPRLELRSIPEFWPEATMPSPPRIDVLA